MTLTERQPYSVDTIFPQDAAKPLTERERPIFTAAEALHSTGKTRIDEESARKHGKWRDWIAQQIPFSIVLDIGGIPIHEGSSHTFIPPQTEDDRWTQQTQVEVVRPDGHEGDLIDVAINLCKIGYRTSLVQNGLYDDGLALKKLRKNEDELWKRKIHPAPNSLVLLPWCVDELDNALLHGRPFRGKTSYSDLVIPDLWIGISESPDQGLVFSWLHTPTKFPDFDNRDTFAENTNAFLQGAAEVVGVWRPPAVEQNTGLAVPDDLIGHNFD